ncbi:ABC transporter permease [Alistipes sp. OttesenSCG-928-B03]|nr:ABC transporter permease [Alistipes sp. OttesenSCG-928-B03]
MNFYNLIKIAYTALLRNKTRALLTMLGIIIGIGSVIAMVSLGQSSQQSINDEISSMGTNMISVMRQWRRGGVNTGSGNVQSLTERDVDAIIDRAQYISLITPTVNYNGQIIYGNNNWPGNVRGANEQWLEINKYEIASGTNFTSLDVRDIAKVAIIGKTVVDNIFPGEDPIGKVIRLNKVPLRVIGVLKSKGASQRGDDQDDVVVVPYTTVMKRMAAINYLHGITASASSEEVADLALDEVTDILRAEHKIRDGQPNDFRVWAQSEMIESMNNISGFLTVLLAAIASISLIVGGIGIMNIMYVTVTERTREIGLRMAIGARNRDILLQFLCESTILALIGGLIGILFGLGLSWGISYALNWPFIMSTTAIAVSFLVCAATGIFFGWYPAKKASNLDPINALRYE